MERPTLRQLEILAEVARVGTFRGAARHLGLSQVAISDHIRQLESRLGCALFVRTAGSKPTLTPSGRIVLEHGRNVLFACDALISAAQGAAGGALAQPVVERPSAPIPQETAQPPILLDYQVDLDVAEEEGGMAEPVLAASPEEQDQQEAGREVVSAPVSVSLFDAVKGATTEGASSPAAPVAAPPAAGDPEPDSVREKSITVASHPAILSRFQDRLAAAQEAFPDRPISVDFAQFTPETVAPALASGRVDIALFYALGEVARLPSDYLWSESWSLFARADHPLAQAEMLRLSDCVDMPVILFEDANPLRALCEACLAKAGLWPAPTVLETDDFAAIATELLEYGEAVFPAFGVTAAQFAARPGLKRLALVEPLPGVQVRRAVAASAEEDPTIAALAGLLG